MKILVVRQPWAWLIVAEGKNIENRSWSTRYRGSILIQASARPDPHIVQIRIDVRERFGIEIPEELDMGGIVGMATLIDCTTLQSGPWHEAGQVGWKLIANRALPFVACKGRLGLFDASVELLDELGL